MKFKFAKKIVSRGRDRRRAARSAKAVGSPLPTPPPMPPPKKENTAFRFLDLPVDLRAEILLDWVFPSPKYPKLIHLNSRNSLQPPGYYDEKLPVAVYRTCKALCGECPSIHHLLGNGSIIPVASFTTGQMNAWEYDLPEDFIKPVMGLASRFLLVCPDLLFPEGTSSSHRFRAWNGSEKAAAVMKTWCKYYCGCRLDSHKTLEVVAVIPQVYATSNRVAYQKCIMGLLRAIRRHSYGNIRDIRVRSLLGDCEPAVVVLFEAAASMALYDYTVFGR